MKIYTKKGDQGQTYLFGGGPFKKDYFRIHCYGEVDELNSVVGCAASFLSDQKLNHELQILQEELFVLGSELSSVNPDEKISAGFLKDENITRLEQSIDTFEQALTPLKNFILPGGEKAAAFLHLARTVCRRAERSVVHLAYQDKEIVRPLIIQYLNRLSDYLFVLARFVNFQSGNSDILWKGLL